MVARKKKKPKKIRKAKRMKKPARKIPQKPKKKRKEYLPCPICGKKHRTIGHHEGRYPLTLGPEAWEEALEALDAYLEEKKYNNYTICALLFAIVSDILGEQARENEEDVQEILQTFREMIEIKRDEGD
jgi:DNA repair exonuclease SbcCD ATPase subunit